MENEDTRYQSLLQGALEAFSEVNFAVLYGSVARGTERLDSDIDLGVALDARTPLGSERLIDISLACSEATGREVQVRDLSRADGIFLKAVMTEGVVLLNRKPAVRAELIIRMLRFVEDMLPNIRMIQRAHRQRNEQELLRGREAHGTETE